MRDRSDNCVVICSIENFDPMGVHTGDSITVAPAQTLSDHEYQRMRDAAFACIRRIGVETGGSNIQFAVDPDERRPGRHRDEPPGQPIQCPGLQGDRLSDRQDRRPAGRRLHPRRDPQRHHRSRRRPASSRPSTTWSPRSPGGPSRSFPGIPDVLGTRMQSVGEAMAIGRTFRESLQKGLRSLERGRLGLNCDPAEAIYDGLGRRRAGPAGGHRHAGPPVPPRGGHPAGHFHRAAVRGDRCGSLVPRPDRADRRRAGPAGRFRRPRFARSPGLAPGQARRLFATPSWPGCGR